jgi:chemotaxis protein histidine kinase CheA
MGSVEQTFAFGERQVHAVAGKEVVVFRDDALEVIRIAARLGFAADGPLGAGVVVRAGGRRRAFAVDELVGQMSPA